MKKPIVLKDLIKECICEENAEALPANEGTLGGILGGGIAGFITGWVSKKSKEKPIAQKDVAIAASNYQQAVADLKASLERHAGNTPDEQYNDFVEKLGTISLAHLKKSPRKFKYKK